MHKRSILRLEYKSIVWKHSYTLVCALPLAYMGWENGMSAKIKYVAPGDGPVTGYAAL